MTENETLDLLFNGGNFSYHYLIKFTLGNNVLRFCNNNKNIVYNDKTYIASTFDYKEPDMLGDSAALSISLIENFDLFQMVENIRDDYVLEVIGVINKDGTITKYDEYNHFYGSLKVSQDLNLQFTLEKDDRLEMQFCVYTFDTENNPTNA